MQFTCKCFWRYFAWLQMTITRMTEILSKYMRTTLHCRALALVFIYATDATLNASMRWSVHLCCTPTPQTIAAWLCWWKLDLCTNITSNGSQQQHNICTLPFLHRCGHTLAPGARAENQLSAKLFGFSKIFCPNSKFHEKLFFRSSSSRSREFIEYLFTFQRFVGRIRALTQN